MPGLFARMRYWYFCILFLSACSPVQGYYGPTLPSEEVATIYLENCDSNLQLIRASSEGVEFGRSGITLLPGERTFDFSIDLLGPRYQCTPQYEFDSWGYENCWNRRRDAIRRNRSYIPTCSRMEYTRHFFMCNQDFTQFVCLVTEEVVRGARYSLCAYQAGNEVNARFSTKNSSAVIAEEECLRSTTEIKRLRFSSP
jgi:hypothetical protein